MDSEQVENDVTDIDIIDPVDISDPVIIYDEAERTGDESSEISGNSLKTGNIIKQLFNLIASLREKKYWELDDKETESLNNTCPKVIPKFITEHSGIIGCALNLLGIIIKRLKLEKQDNQIDNIVNDVVKDEEMPGLTGGRTE